MKVYEAIGDTLSRLGVDTVFGLLGSGNFDLVHHMAENRGVTFRASRHEAASVGMAAGYALASGRLGIATVHQGPGVTNTLTALTEAVKSRVPLLLIAADTATTALHQNLDIEQDAVVRSVGAAVQRMRGAKTAVEDVTLAVRRAEVERRPVVISVPIDLQEQDCEVSEPPVPVGYEISSARPSQEAVQRIADLLELAQRPLIIGGRGAVLASAGPALKRLGDRVGALFATSAAAKGLFAGSPFDLGISGGFASPLAARLIQEADVILSFGASLNHWMTGHGNLISPEARVVHCDTEASALGRIQPVSLGVVGDAAETAEALLDELVLRGAEMEGFRTESVLRDLQNFRWEDTFEDESTEDTVDPRSVLIELDRLLPAERTVAVDCGHFMGFPARHLSVPDPSAFVFAEAFQSVGLGFGTGMGAAVARPERLAVVVIGDGGLLMSLGELDAAIHLGLPLLVVVINDAAYGAEVHHFRPKGVSLDLARFEGTDFAAVATAMGERGLVVRGISDLSSLEEWLANPEGLMVVDCKVNPQVEGDYLREAFRAEA
ncbi:MAG: thiamine pyrophosphate-binding protein [Actinomycetota bacterium]|nr:thiamine pyrophosphate-binding protein [Actinomycetota bacterium]